MSNRQFRQPRGTAGLSLDDAIQPNVNDRIAELNEARLNIGR